ncbi:MAG TPA: lysophospholipid acyltransferase family protein [Deltaproteobacteria bacterium]|jgi:putative hemolysin|nr:lysophospholipid acyltransferase family protein [Deltaproteobacteria bacterium]
MEEMVGGAVEAFYGHGGTSRRSGWGQRFKSLFLKRVLPLKRLNYLYSQLNLLSNETAIPDRILEVLGLTYEISTSDQARAPSEGPLVVVANHPFGAVEGIILASILLKKRSDIKIMANFLLGGLGVRELNELLIFVDPFERQGSVAHNLKPLREAIEWVRGGRALGIFPAGEVSHMHLSSLSVIDRQWSRTVARIVRKSEATMLPVYFEGRNSPLFCGLGLLHPLLRTLMLPGENLKKRPRVVRAHVGRPVPFKRLAELDDSAIMDYLRLRTYNLGNRKCEKHRNLLFRRPINSAARHRPVARAKKAGLIAAEIRCLPPEQLLFSSKNFDLVSASAPQIPNALHEIGRLREISFRKAGEGTGNAVDMDRFDEYYQQIMLWDRERDEIIGGYRLGRADAILKERGFAGLYTSTLFEYRDELAPKFRWALELGRSFVRPEHQKTYQPLMLLWAGIGRFVAKHPRYRYLFGAVSINNEYLGVSRKLMVEFLNEGHTHSDLARFVRARNSPPFRAMGKKHLGLAYSMVHKIQDLSELISDIEQNGAGIPILLKHYMRLGGKFLGFSVDPKFNNALDALVLVDLARTDLRILGRYMGQQGAVSFLHFNGVGPEGAADCSLPDGKCA